MKIVNQNGNKLIMINDGKFKSFRMIISFHTPQGEEYASLNSLLINILKFSCEKYPDKERLSLALDGMYGAKLSTCTVKAGGYLLPSFVFDFVSSKYSGQNQLEKAFELASEIVFKPDFENGSFKEKVIELERENVIREIQSVINDKRLYALEQCVKHTCGKDPYGVSPYGSVDFCRRITADDLYKHYKYILTKCNTSVVIAGDFDAMEAEALSRKFSEKLGRSEMIKTDIIPKRSKPQYIKETAAITQGKLVMSFTTGIGDAPQRHTESVLNGIFGGNVSSKLFNVVREKMSLCYYASSRFDKHKGLIIAQCGIDCENYQKTVDAVLAQMDEIKKGNFSDEEFDNTVASIVSAANMTTDSLPELLSFYHTQVASDEVLQPAELIERIRSVTREQIIDLSRLIELDTIYFLSGESEVN